MYRHYTAVRSVPRKLRAIEGFSHKGESVKRGSTVCLLLKMCIWGGGGGALPDQYLQVLWNRLNLLHFQL